MKGDWKSFIKETSSQTFDNLLRESEPIAMSDLIGGFFKNVAAVLSRMFVHDVQISTEPIGSLLKLGFESCGNFIVESNSTKSEWGLKATFNPLHINGTGLMVNTEIKLSYTSYICLHMRTMEVCTDLCMGWIIAIHCNK